ncbi:hypothetical protein B5D82_01890 [Cognaticolwellia beringensis]|uniref:Polysaccharide biosynthesis protein C-terminal domain-containing protein n=2 Tax=Cognaticolwellia beringensis TaxID=1967665 RepID=A0A222G3Z4_9GAMM|nr:hypothetical protein B5D82_01890 [Cognaticolwellia beringensis]
MFLTMALGFLFASHLGPVKFGDYSYLVVIFTSLIRFVDLSVSKAYFTFLSANNTNNKNLVEFIVFAIGQLVLFLLVIIFIPNSYLIELGVGDDRILLAVVVTSLFIQQRLWNFFSYIIEYIRATFVFQKISTKITMLHFVVICLLYYAEYLNIFTIFLSILFSWSLGIFVFLSNKVRINEISKCLKGNPYTKIADYKEYCFPLIPYSILVLIYDVSDRWLLQKISTAGEQGYFALSKQISIVSLIATTSILNVFWRELSASKNDLIKINELAQNTTISLFLFASFLSCFVIPWSSDLLLYFFGEEYLKANLTFMIMMIFPIHQVVGQISSVILLALGKTKLQMILGIVSIIFNLSVSIALFLFVDYRILDTVSSEVIAFKLVVIQLVSTNLFLFFLRKSHGINVIGFSQFTIPILLLFISYLCQIIIQQFGVSGFLFNISLCGFLYFGVFTLLLIKFPSLLGISVKQEDFLRGMLIKCRKLLSF